MRPLLQQLQDMHIRIAETATHEETLVRALSEALDRLDQQLLQDVQTIASEHEARRSAILGELQGLASSIGMFQVQHPQVTARADLEEPTYLPTAGDWREAASNIRDDLEPVSASAAPRALFPHERRANESAAPVSLMQRRRRAAG
ncbi:hypothetical protein GIW81_01730 [Hyphomicrobium sp. xq]|uniref:Uncharacterized protein n=1 Tax=Hyphomicrobium album TaxID=2665159 RepID=A0A6I3KFH8_9HYPH|nr:hypothetical protein [Hyphomicrobium album]MTD93049.1 hypothetical protein [Hyphomicrobium album]